LSSSAARAEVRAPAAKRDRKPKRVSKRGIKKPDGRYLIYYDSPHELRGKDVSSRGPLKA